MDEKIINSIEPSGRSTDVLEFCFALFLTILLSYATEKIYNKYSKTVSHKEFFSSFFILFSVSIFLIFSIIKSSVVLSLGLVGALSVVRFRNAIKDTEQIMYLLLLIAISISLAANQYIFVIISVSTLFIIIFTKDYLSTEREKTKLLFIQLEQSNQIEKIIALLEGKCTFQIIGLEHINGVFNLHISITSKDDNIFKSLNVELANISSRYRISESD
jgi:hypothetical protein